MKSQHWTWFVPETRCPLCESESANIILIIEETTIEYVKFHVYCRECHKHALAQMDIDIWWLFTNGTPPTETDN